MRLMLVGSAVLLALLAGAPALAAETIRYKYDARGRLVEVVRTGVGGQPNVKREYQYDRANNRKLRRTTPP